MLNFWKKQKKIVVRMAPSPTGNLHIGTARTALFNYLFAKGQKGKFILRMEDTDVKRSKEEYEKDILDRLSWLGLEYDEFYRQSEREDIYRSYINKMLENGSAYISKEDIKENDSSSEEEERRSEVVRFKNPNKKVAFNDLVRGSIAFDTEELGDFVIAKSPTEPLYHLAVVVDDHEMGVTHVIRGEDHISNTPRQILIQEAIGASRPEYAHIPLILDEKKAKLSKRKHGEAVRVGAYKEKGYLPEALLNYLALLGWNPGTEEEIFTLAELIEKFSLAKVQKGGAVFNEKKLRWVNKEHIKMLDREEILKLVHDKIDKYFSNIDTHSKLENFNVLLDVIIERIEIFSDIDDMLRVGDLDYFFFEPDLDVNKIPWKGEALESAAKHLEKAKEIIENGGDLMKYAEEAGKGNVLWPVRYSLSGKEKSPDPFTLIKALGTDESKKRLEKAIELIKA